MICISHCHIMVLSMLMLWLPKNTFLNLFFVFEHFFHFYACALRFTCIICTFILHIKLWMNFICEFFICLHTICKHYSSLTKITRWLDFMMWQLHFFFKKTLYYAAASKYLCFIDFGPLYVSLLHIFTSYMHFVSWFMMFSMTSMYF